MQIRDILIDHNKVPEQNFPKPSLKNTVKVGKISLKDGSIADVYKKQIENQIQYIAVYKDKIIGFVNMVIIPNRNHLVMAKNAQSWIKGKNVLLNLLLFCKNDIGVRILSDTEMSNSGEDAWLKIIKNPRFDAKIYNFDLDKTYDINDPLAVKPENDQKVNKDALNWFYMIESVISTKFNHNMIEGLCLPNYYD